ncbi:MAG: hypothetical protein DWI22_15830 [Planctomycetota bacterium]|nr:MAG: hypothetical protein DWI22_15830 [Planctomycetota bacterium]
MVLLKPFMQMPRSEIFHMRQSASGSYSSAAGNSNAIVGRKCKSHPNLRTSGSDSEQISQSLNPNSPNSLTP